jgi:hypothetical protein
MFEGKVRPEPTGAKYFSIAPLWGWLLALPTNITLGWNVLQGTNTLAYYENFENYGQKSFITLSLVASTIKVLQ